MIGQIKSALPLEAVLRDAGVVLNRGKGLCPFHEDRSPSFSIRGERWTCFAGCGSGDVIDFTAKYHGLDAKGAIKLLADRAGLRRADTHAAKQAALKARREREKKAQLVKEFRKWERSTADDIAKVLRFYRHLRATRTTFTEAELVVLAELQGEIDVLEYHYSILSGRDDKEKFELWKEMKYV